MHLSFIVCTRNRAYALNECLQAIVTSINHAGCRDAEIVAVDNGSTDNTSDVLAELEKSSPVPIKPVYEPRKGLSAARNAGVRASNGTIVVFIDDDCRMSPSYVQELLDYDSKDKELVMRSGSVVLGDPADLPLTIKSVEKTQCWKKPMDPESEGRLLGSLIGCNMAMRRAVIDRLGAFDERLGAGTNCPAAEDTDYFYRAYLAGMRLEMVPNMIVKHFHGRKNIKDQGNLMRNYAIGNGALSVKYFFRYPFFFRHFYWVLKNGILEIITYGNKGAPGAEIAPFDNMRYTVFGACVYMCSRLSGRRA